MHKNEQVYSVNKCPTKMATSRADGRSLKEINLRVETGVTIIAVKRAEKIYHNPSADFILKAGDIILLISKRENINRALEYLESDRFLVQKYYK